jgi:hypothetical protein
MDSNNVSKLTNLKCEDEYGLFGWYSNFSISELEVWEVIFEK